MYEDTQARNNNSTTYDKDARSKEFAVWVGIDIRIAEIFVKRIPLKFTRVSASGKVHEIDGDTVIFSVLANIAEMKHSVTRKDRENILEKYNSFVTHGVHSNKHNLPTIMRLTVEKKLKRYMPKGCVSLDELDEDEIGALYDWII